MQNKGYMKGRILFLQKLDVSPNTMRRLIVCALYNILLLLSNQGG